MRERDIPSSKLNGHIYSDAASNSASPFVGQESSDQNVSELPPSSELVPDFNSEPEDIENRLAEIEEFMKESEGEKDSRYDSKLRGLDLSDPLNIYFHDMRSIGLLTREQEIAFAQAKDEGDQDARDQLVESNLRWVVAVAKRYRGRGLELGDLIQEGNMGLMKAIDKFDWRKGYRLNTYATWYIFQGITRAIADKGRGVRLPVSFVDEVNRVRRVSNRLTLENGYTPTNAEIASVLHIDEDRVIKIQQNSQQIDSLNRLVGDDEEAELGDFIQDENNDTAEEATENVYKDGILEALDVLSERQRRVIILRFGLDGEEPLTLERVGELLEVTRERVRQIQEEALAKLAGNGRARTLLLEEDGISEQTGTQRESLAKGEIIFDGASIDDNKKQPVLTARQAEVLEQIGQGVSRREIAANLGMSYMTVKNHISAINRVFDVSSSTDAVLKAYEQGILSSDHPPTYVLIAKGKDPHELLPPVKLTCKEREVYLGVISGKSNKEIASAQDIIEQTVKNHVTNLLRKLGVKNRSELQRLAMHGWKTEESKSL